MSDPRFEAPPAQLPLTNSESFRAADALRQPFMNQKNCARCHETPTRDFKLTPLTLDREWLFKPAAPEVKRAEKTPEQRLEALPPVGKVAHVLSRLPDQMDLTIKDGKVSFSTNFRQFLEAMPGVKPEKILADTLSAIKSVELEKDKFSARLEKRLSLAVDVDLKVARVKEIRVGTDKDPRFSFEIGFNPKETGAFALKNIEGLTLVTDGGLQIAVKGVELKIKDGKPVCEFAVENPFRVPPTATVSQPLEKVLPGLDFETVKQMVRALHDAKTSLDKKDFSVYLDRISEPGMRDTVKKICEGVTSISKDGDKFTLSRNNGVAEYNLGGPSIKVAPTVTFRVGKDAEAPKISDITGVLLQVPLPGELRLGNYYTSIKEVGLGYASSNGHRTVTVKTDGEVKSASVRLNADMQPAVDSAGSFYVDATVKNLLSSRPTDNLYVNLRITNGQLNMKPSEIASIVSRATYQAADLSPKGAGLMAVSTASKFFSWIAP